MNKSLTELTQKLMLMEYLQACCDLFKYTLLHGKQEFCRDKYSDSRLS